MNQEDIKKEIKDLSYGIQFHREQGDFHHGVADKRLASVKRLEAQLVEVEKPELRHWDLALDKQGKPHIVIADMEKVLQVAGPTFLCIVGVHGYRKIGKLQDYFDDLKARQEPLKEFKTEYAGETTEWSLSPQCKDLIFFIDKKTWIVRHQNIPKLILNLQRLLFTAGKEASRE